MEEDATSLQPRDRSQSSNPDLTIAMRTISALSRRSSTSDPGQIRDVPTRLDPRLVRSAVEDAPLKYPGPRHLEDVFWRPPAAEAFGKQLSWCRDPRARHPIRFLVEAVAIFSNILAGPGILGCPAMVQNSGWVLSFLALGIFAVMTARTSSLLAKALRQMTLQERAPGMAAYPRYELADLVRATFGHTAFYLFQVILNTGMLLLCLASIVAAQQAVDDILVKISGNSYVFELSGAYGFGIGKACESEPCGSELFIETNFGITVGYVVVSFLCVPLTFTNFANLMWFQYIAMAVSTIAVAIFSVTCFLPSPSTIAPNQNWFMPPAFGNDPSLCISTCFLCFAIGFAVPSWWNDNEPDCPAAKAIHTSMIYSILVYYLPITFLPAFAFVLPTKSALDLFVDPHAVNPVCVAAALSLALIGIMPNIIAYSVAMRDNMQALGPWFTFRKCLAIGCIGPWLFGWSLCFGVTFQTIVQWTSIGILGIINFIVPLTLVLKLAGIQREAELYASEIAGASCDGGTAASLVTALPAEVEPWTRAEVVRAKIMLVVAYLLVGGGYACLIAVKLLGVGVKP